MDSTRTVDIGHLIDNIPVGRAQKLILFLCFLVALVDGLDQQAVAFVATVIANEWNINVSEFGIVFGANLLGFTVGSFIFGSLGDRFGRRKILLTSVVLFGLSSVLSAYASTPITLAILRFVTGLGLGGASPALAALIAEFLPSQKRGWYLALVFSGFPLGAGMGGVAAAMLVPTLGWPTLFWVGGILPIVLIPALWIYLPESPRFLLLIGNDGKRIARILNRMMGIPNAMSGSEHFICTDMNRGKGQVRQLFCNKRWKTTVIMWAIFFASLLILYFLVNWLPTVLQQAGLPYRDAVKATVVLSLGSVVGGLVVGPTIDRFGSTKVLVTWYVVTVVSVACIGIAQQSVPFILASAFMSGFGVTGAQFGMNTLAATYYPIEVRSTGMGWALGFGKMGSVLGPTLGSVLIANAVPVKGIFTIAAIPAVIACLLILALAMVRKQDPDHSLAI